MILFAQLAMGPVILSINNLAQNVVVPVRKKELVERVVDQAMWIADNL